MTDMEQLIANLGERLQARLDEIPMPEPQRLVKITYILTQNNAQRGEPPCKYTRTIHAAILPRLEDAIIVASDHSRDYEACVWRATWSLDLESATVELLANNLEGIPTSALYTTGWSKIKEPSQCALHDGLVKDQGAQAVTLSKAISQAVECLVRASGRSFWRYFEPLTWRWFWWYVFPVIVVLAVVLAALEVSGR